ncbi:mitotic spindle checkpoint protein Bub3 [Mortierella sp. NVP85]|nr:mitotic spindle checkpoint protein Bub3 [Mortierella sp. NVP85]
MNNYWWNYVGSSKEEEYTEEEEEEEMLESSTSEWLQDTPEPREITLIRGPPKDTVTALQVDPLYSEFLLATSWDKTLSVYDIVHNCLRTRYEHSSPVLCGTWGSKNTIYTAGIDGSVWSHDWSSGDHRKIYSHEDVVTSAAFHRGKNILVTGSWDKTIRIWDGRTPVSLDTDYSWRIKVPGKVYALDMDHDCLVVATSDDYDPKNFQVNGFSSQGSSDTNKGGYFHTYDLRKLSEATLSLLDGNPGLVLKPSYSAVSAMAYRTRILKCIPPPTPSQYRRVTGGFVYSSVDGTVGLIYHNEPQTTISMATYGLQQNGRFESYPINAIAFNPKIQGFFACGGSSGHVETWHPSTTKSIQKFPRSDLSVSALTYMPNGKRMVVAYGDTFDSPSSAPDRRKVEPRIVIRAADLDPDQLLVQPMDLA